MIGKNRALISITKNFYGLLKMAKFARFAEVQENEISETINTVDNVELVVGFKEDRS